MVEPADRRIVEPAQEPEVEPEPRNRPRTGVFRRGDVPAATHARWLAGMINKQRQNVATPPPSAAAHLPHAALAAPVVGDASTRLSSDTLPPAAAGVGDASTTARTQPSSTLPPAQPPPMQPAE